MRAVTIDLLAKPMAVPEHRTSMTASPRSLIVAIPAYLEDLVLALDQIDASARGLVRNLTEGQFHWQPLGGHSWSVAQCIEHLTVTNSLYVTAIRQAVDDAERHRMAPSTTVKLGLWARFFVWNMEPPPKLKLRARAQITSNPKRTRGELWLAFTHAEERVRRLMIESAGIDVNRTRFANPLLPGTRFSIGVGFMIVLAHNRRHLWQAQRVCEAPGFAAA